MAKIWEIEEEKEIKYDNFIENLRYLDNKIFHEDNQIIVAKLLSRLYLNRRFLGELINKNIKEIILADEINSYTAQIFCLHKDKKFNLRAPVWKPVTNKAGEKIFSYNIPHDHNFSFYTLGYLGSGYTTKLYSYDSEKIVGYEGEKVEMKELETVALTEGKVMLYEAKKDIHTQLPSEELSISINVIDNNIHDAQYSFDTQKFCIKSQLNFSFEELIIKVGVAIGNENTIDLLWDITRKNNEPRVRLEAYSALSTLLGNKVWEKAIMDESKLVSWYAQKNLNICEN